MQFRAIALTVAMTGLVAGGLTLLASPAFASDAALASITNPPAQIATATVLDASGATVGAVQRVEVTPDGRPTQVAISLIGQPDALVVLNAAKVHYDAADNRIIADASSAQIRALTPNG